MQSDDGLGLAMSLHYAAEEGRKAQEENRNLRKEIDDLKARISRLEDILK